MTGLNDDDERQRDLLFVGLRLFGSGSVIRRAQTSSLGCMLKDSMPFQREVCSSTAVCTAAPSDSG